MIRLKRHAEMGHKPSKLYKGYLYNEEASLE